jgi:hypothetical protein
LEDWAERWRWSSTRAHLTGKDDGITARAPIRERFPDFAGLFGTEADADALARLRAAESVGRPLGDGGFLAWIERATGRRLAPGSAGRSHGWTPTRTARRSWICCAERVGESGRARQVAGGATERRQPRARDGQFNALSP